MNDHHRREVIRKVLYTVLSVLYRTALVSRYHGLLEPRFGHWFVLVHGRSLPSPVIAVYVQRTVQYTVRYTLYSVCIIRYNMYSIYIYTYCTLLPSGVLYR